MQFRTKIKCRWTVCLLLTSRGPLSSDEARPERAIPRVQSPLTIPLTVGHFPGAVVPGRYPGSPGWGVGRSLPAPVGWGWVVAGGVAGQRWKGKPHALWEASQLGPALKTGDLSLQPGNLRLLPQKSSVIILACVPGAQLVEEGANNTSVKGQIPREHSYWYKRVYLYNAVKHLWLNVTVFSLSCTCSVHSDSNLCIVTNLKMRSKQVNICLKELQTAGCTALWSINRTDQKPLIS